MWRRCSFTGCTARTRRIASRWTFAIASPGSCACTGGASGAARRSASRYAPSSTSSTVADRAVSSLDRERVQRVLRATLYEGYALYPYRADALKNRRRFMFGTLHPAVAGSAEPTMATTECLVRGDARTGLRRPAHGRPEDARLAVLASVHTLLGVAGGRFVSLLDPPAEVREAAAACANIGTWPVLVGEPGEDDAMLSAPIILYDHPAVAPESAGDLFDLTEIAELLTLRTRPLTDA